MHPGKTLAPLHAGEKHQVSSSSRRHLYEDARKPVREDKGTPYPCTQQDLDGYVQHHHPNRDARYITPIEATNELCDWLNHFNEPDASSMAALKRLKTGIKLEPWQPDLVIKAFKDLDLAFFKGTLMGNVRVKWMCRQEWANYRGPNTGYLGITQKEGHAQCRIVLNAETVLLKPASAPIPFREMWRTVLHEMCHAYLCVKCGCYDGRLLPADPDLSTWSNGHGTLFRRCIHSVDRRARRYLQLSAISSWEDYKDHC